MQRPEFDYPSKHDDMLVNGTETQRDFCLEDQTPLLHFLITPVMTGSSYQTKSVMPRRVMTPQQLHIFQGPG